MIRSRESMYIVNRIGPSPEPCQFWGKEKMPCRCQGHSGASKSIVTSEECRRASLITHHIEP